MSTHWNKFLLPHNSYLIYSMDCIKNLQFEQNNKSHDKWNLSFFQKDLHIKLHLNAIRWCIWMYSDGNETTSIQKTEPARRAHDIIIIILDAFWYSVYSRTIFMNNLFQRAYNSIFTRNYFHVNEQHNLHLKFCLEWWLCY